MEPALGGSARDAGCHRRLGPTDTGPDEFPEPMLLLTFRQPHATPPYRWVLQRLLELKGPDSARLAPGARNPRDRGEPRRPSKFEEVRDLVVEGLRPLDQDHVPQLPHHHLPRSH